MSSPTYPFLSDEWVEAARALRSEYEGRIPEPPASVRLNTIITDSPHHDGPLHGHIDTTRGEIIIDEGHIDAPDLTVTVDYATAKAAFVARDPQAVMQSFLSGKILVEGDVMKLMALQSAQPTADAVEMYERLDAFTARD
ncbi:MAG: SCP2 sterol-binding domain-containing protein [Acidimicrobiales bacterium]